MVPAINGGSKLCADNPTMLRVSDGFPPSAFAQLGKGRGVGPPRCIPSLCAAARGNRARFRTVRPARRCRVSRMAGAPMTANDNAQPPRYKRSGSEKRERAKRFSGSWPTSAPLSRKRPARSASVSPAMAAHPCWAHPARAPGAALPSMPKPWAARRRR